ncbi:Carboxysome shell and ethanolamine utilization microcompartment protein CcmL/EutN [Clostridium collagenovorans DSM 3089]|uniref:Carboxysome shell and ethanolamine utilization microcompartment protein CcmL/EutN n=1 Tax=Clostridium collagenovorans DSM 3089 TaxID=1121306 RepID=A0A1M5TCD1_9CLOT|nr:BMC domain-containing protein [Clostridium collagenovorans]SHH48346.1 Carboxysome shell and ethanolamine utilization microcompartment protein CcmL/EutN [Clostridium collagenovorans DSM 3089]
MEKSTLGLIETYGFIGAVEALDVALKSANVELVSCEFVKAGIVTILITGDVASVKASVEAAAVAADRIGTLLNTHVIARADDEVWNIIGGRKKDNIEEIKERIKEDLTFNAENKENSLDQEDLEVEAENTTDVVESEDITEELIISENVLAKEVKQDKLSYTREELETLKVPELRSLARKMELKSLTKKQIKFSKKEQLIEAILQG